MIIEGSYYRIQFQEGPVRQMGINGTQANEVLTAIGAYLYACNSQLPCRETSLAITKIEEAVFWLNERTRKRLEQNVEGTNEAHK